MDTNSFTNMKIIGIEKHTDTYTVKVPLRKSYIEGYDKFTFSIIGRKTLKEIELPFQISNIIEDFIIVDMKIDFSQIPFLDVAGENWDLYLFRMGFDETKKNRVSCKPEHLQFLSVFTNDGNRIFYPYRTSKGNLSFRTNKGDIVFGIIDEIHLKKQGDFHFSGCINFPELFQKANTSILKMNLVVTNNLEDKETIIPLKLRERKDLEELYEGNNQLGRAGFEGFFNPKEYIVSDRRQFFKFFVDVEYEDSGVVKVRRSTRLRLFEQANTLPAYVKLKNRGNQIRVRAALTKKAQYLTVQSYPYNALTNNIKKMKKKIVKARRSSVIKKAYQVLFSIAGKVLPVNKKLVMFESFLGKQFSDNPRAMYEYMKEQYPDYKLIWSADRRSAKVFEEKEITYIRRFSFRWLLNMNRAGYWVTNSRLPLWIPKPSHTVYVQTWHGTPLKRLAADMDQVLMPGTNTNAYKRNFLKEAAKWDYLVSPNAYSSEIFERAFDFNKTVLETGYPRNDILYLQNNTDYINTLKQKLGLPSKKVILYAPTWRDNQFHRKGKYKFDLELNLALMKEELGDDYVIVLRLHYLVAENIDLSSYEGFAYDFSNYEDIRELYLISDVLITDYSSVFFDYANLKRPIFFFVYDLEDYRDNLRGFYFDFENRAPGPLYKETDQIITGIKEIDKEGYTNKLEYEQFYKRFCYLEDGKATKRVVDAIFER
ncbi:CDP-glycerol glycerophosphotransferase family protein [Terribacillus saccharophilus]|uniref:CDP-glycerol glycerophosphotransferase family protein n=1 Tax=Terribacillus saccharophilus TaxID=361277 RepID=UPI0039823C92